MAKRESKVEGVNALPELEAGFTEIKNLFKAGALPREADYVKLIEYVHYLHKLLGVEGVDGSSGPGLGGGLSYSGSVISVGAGAGIIVDTNGVSLDAVTVAGRGLLGVAGVIYIGGGPGITVDADSISLNAGAVAGKGLTGADGVINVGAGKGVLVEDNAVSLAVNSWEYIFAKLYGATHWVRSERVVIYFTRISDARVVARGICRGGNAFGTVMSRFTWNTNTPEVEESSLDRGYFTLVFFDEGSIGGLFTVYIAGNSYVNFVTELDS